MTQLIATGRRKYSAILEQLIEKSLCRVECKLADVRTIIDGVKKEKVKWKHKEKWPKGKALKIDIVDESDYKGITFRMILDTSVNNL